jgi:hypothetical protein
MAALVITANLWDQSLGPWVNEFMKDCDIYTIEYYSPIMVSEIMLFSGKKWVELWILMLNKISQAQKAKCHMLFIICGL